MAFSSSSIPPIPAPGAATTHDVGLFALSAPDGWSVQRLTPDTFVLADPGHEIALTFLVATAEPLPRSGAVTRDLHAELLHWVKRHPHVRVKRPPHPVAGHGQSALGAEGMQRLSGEVPWYLRLLRKSPALAWRFWALLGPRNLLFIRTSAQREVLDRFGPTLERIIASLRLPVTDLLTGQRFVDAVIRLARNRFPDAVISLRDEDTLCIGASPISLQPLKLRYLEAPTHLPDQAGRYFAALATELPAAHLADAWSAARDSIMPVLLNPSNLHASTGRLVSEQWINHLSVGYALERPSDPERPITSSDTHHWGVSLDTIHDHALANLIRRSRDQTMQGQKTDDYTMLVIASPDRHNAARILLPEFYQRLRQHLGGTFYAAVPSRELLVAFSASRDDLRDQLRKQIADDFLHAKDGLSDKLFLVTPDGIAGDPDEAEDFAF